MGKYLSMTEVTVPASEIQELEENLSWNQQAVEALKLLEKHRGNVSAAIAEIANEYGNKANTLIQEADQAGRKLAADATQATIDNLPSLAGSVVASLTIKTGPGAIAIQYLVAIAIRTFLMQRGNQ